MLLAGAAWLLVGVVPADLTVLLLLLDGVPEVLTVVVFDLVAVEVCLEGDELLTLLSLPLVLIVFTLVFLDEPADVEREEELVKVLRDDSVVPEAFCDLDVPRLCSSAYLLDAPLFLLLKPRPGFSLS